MLFAYILLKIIDRETVSAYNAKLTLFLIPCSYACEGCTRQTVQKFLNALIFNLSIIVIKRS
jgi:hypothetical protein